MKKQLKRYCRNQIMRIETFKGRYDYVKRLSGKNWHVIFKVESNVIYIITIYYD